MTNWQGIVLPSKNYAKFIQISNSKSWAIHVQSITMGDNSPFSSSWDTTVQNLDFTRQTTDITHFAVVFHYDVISI